MAKTLAPISIPIDSDSLKREFGTLQTWGVRLREVAPQQGVWIPFDKSGAGLVLAALTPVVFIRMGALVFVFGALTYPATADVSIATFSLPFPVSATFAFMHASSGGADKLQIQANTQQAYPLLAGAVVTNASLSGLSVYFSGVYRMAD